MAFFFIHYEVLSSFSYQRNYPSVFEIDLSELFEANPSALVLPMPPRSCLILFTDTTCLLLVQWTPSWQSYITAFFLFRGLHLTISNGSPCPESKNVVPERPGECHCSWTRTRPSPPWEARTPCLPGMPRSCQLRKQDPWSGMRNLLCSLWS